MHQAVMIQLELPMVGLTKSYKLKKIYMKKILFSTIMIFFFFGQLFAQTDPSRDELALIFQYIDKSQIPSGYLDEYGPQVVDKNWLNGILTDSNRIYDVNLFRYLYNDIEMPGFIAMPQPLRH